MAKLSVIIPSYNSEKYLRPCLDSLLSQNFKDFEAICINNGSTDKTAKILKEYANKDKRFVFINLKEKGLSEARNSGLKQAKSKYLAFLDSDDVLHPDTFKILINLIEKHNADIISFDHQPVHSDFTLKSPQPLSLKTIEVSSSNRPFKDFISQKKWAVPVWLKLYRKEIIKDIRFPIGVQPGEDTVFSLEAFYNAQKAISIPNKLIYYRIHQSSVSRSETFFQYVKSQIDVAQTLYDYFISSGRLSNSESEKKLITRYINKRFYKAIQLNSRFRRLSRQDQKKIRSFAKELLSQKIKDGVFTPDILGFRRSIITSFYLR